MMKKDKKLNSELSSDYNAKQQISSSNGGVVGSRGRNNILLLQDIQSDYRLGSVQMIENTNNDFQSKVSSK